jgi:hypothetical protein
LPRYIGVIILIAWQVPRGISWETMNEFGISLLRFETVALRQFGH